MSGWDEAIGVAMKRRVCIPGEKVIAARGAVKHQRSTLTGYVWCGLGRSVLRPYTSYGES
jgi:hypothetical protein